MLVQKYLSSKKQVELLKLKNEQLQSIYDRMPDVYYQVDAECRILWGSPSAEKLIGYTVDELIGTKLSDYYVNSDDHQLFLQKLEESGGKLAYYEQQVRHKNGEVIWVSTHAQFVYDQNHHVVGIEGIIRDITKEKNMANSLLEMEKYKAVTGLVAGIAHYFNNDLAGISGALYVLRKHMKRYGEHTQYVQKAEDRVMHMAQIIRDLLTFSKYKFDCAGKASLQTVIHEAVEAIKKEYANSAVNMSLLDMEIQVDCVSDLLRKAILHVLRNAHQAVQTTDQADIRIDMKLLGQDQAWVRLSIQDYGVGMSEETLLRAGEPFFTTQEVGKGEGLGLPVASGVIQQCGGRLILESKLGQGTTVHMDIPVSSCD